MKLKFSYQVIPYCTVRDAIQTTASSALSQQITATHILGLWLPENWGGKQSSSPLSL